MIKIPPKNNSSHYFTSSHSAVRNIKKLFIAVRRQNLVLQTSGEVFSPEKLDKGTEILLNSIILPESKEKLNILDLGAGYGPITIWLAKTLADEVFNQKILPDQYKIYASEVNERAVWLMKRNILVNNCKNIEILRGPFQDRINELKEQGIRFQAVYSNPPLKMGHKTMLDLFQAAADLLTEYGFIQYVHKKKLGAEGFQNKLQELYPSWSLVTLKKQAGYHVIIFSKHPISLPPRITTSSGYF
ncbi:MAG: class I SAM-dependent methyltransferase [Promethearchaeota archaeon]